MRNRPWGKRLFFPVLASVFLFLLAGCFYNLTLEPPSTLKIDPKEYQPVVLFPILDAPGHPESGANQYSFIRNFLEKKGYVLVKKDRVAEVLEEVKLTPLLLLSDPDSVVKIGAILKAKLLIITTIPEYKVQKSYWGAQTFQVWDRESFDSLSLPTYHRGTSQIRLILRMFEAEKGELVWVAEGSIRAAGGSAEAYGEKLAERLLKDLPAVSPPMRP